MRRLLPGTTGWPRTTWVLRVLVLLLPVAALMVALPEWPHTAVVVLVAVGSVRWAWAPDDLVGAIVLVLVGGWWGANGATDARLLAVGVLLLAAHVAATLASYGPGTLDPGHALVRLWVRRGLLALVPLPVALAAVGLFDAGLASPGLWTVALAATTVLLLVASRATGRVQG